MRPRFCTEVGASQASGRPTVEIRDLLHHIVRYLPHSARSTQAGTLLKGLLAALICLGVPAQALAQQPDLAVTSLIVSGGALNLVVSSTVQNNSTATISTSFQNGYFLSIDETVDGTDTLLGSYTVSSLTTNASFTDTNRTLPIPGGTRPGSYFVGCIADTGSAITESNENNNTTVAGGTVNLPFPAEVVVFPLDAPARVSTGQSFIASFQVVNAGENGFTLDTATLSFSGAGLTVTPQSLPASIAGETIVTYVFNVAVAANADNQIQTASIAISGTDAATGATVSDSDTNAGAVQVLSASTTQFTDLNSNAKSIFDLGSELIFVTVSDGNQNKIASSQQTVLVTVTSSFNGDTETITLRETGNDTGVFRNQFGVATASGNRNDQDGTIQTAPGALLTASYADVDDSGDTSTGQATIRLTPTASSGQFTNSAGAQQFFYAIGVDPIFVSITDSDRNTRPAVVDSVTVTVTDQSTGDTQTLTLQETAIASGQFRNTAGLPSVRNVAPTGDNGVLETADEATIRFNYTDPVNSDTATGTTVMKFRTASTTRFTNTGGGAVSAYTLGIDQAFVTVIDGDRNISESSQQNVAVTLRVSSTGDTENITLQETGNNTGIFRNATGIAFQLAARADNNGSLEVTGGAIVTSTYTDPGDASDVTSASAEVNGQQTSSQTAFTDTTGTVKDTYLIGGEAVFVTVTDADENTDPLTVQTVTINVVDGITGDLEVLTLTETGNSTGIFRNTTGLATVLGARSDNNGILETANLANLSANYQDNDSSGDTSFSFAGMRLASTNSTTRFTLADGTPSTQFKIGVDPIFVTVEDRNRNDDINSRQTVSVLIRNQINNDQETVQLLETSNNTGVFRNAVGVQSSFSGTGATTGDTVVQAFDSNSVLAQYVDTTNPNDFSTGIMVLRFITASTTKLTDRDGNEVAQYVVPRDGLFVTIQDGDRMSATTGTILPSQVDFDSQVQKVFNRACWKCHSPSGRTSGALPPAGTPSPNQGGLDLTGFESLKKGGNSGQVFIVSNGSGSLITRKLNGQAVHQGGAVPTVATSGEFDLLKNWIDQGSIPPTTPSSVNYTQELEIPLFRGRCDTAGCHDSATASGGLNMTQPSQTAFVSNSRIIPGNGPDSRVVRILKGQLTHTGGNSGLSAAQIRLISIWISQRVQDSQPDQRLQFTGDILPLLDRSCSNSRCHDAVNPSGNLDLTSFANLIRGGTNGNPTIPGDGPASLLIQAIDGRINHTGGFGDPPLVQQANETQTLISWINQGATAPPTPPAASAPVTTNTLTVVVTDALTGDREELLLRELANALGTFRNTAPFATAIQPAAGRNDTFDTAGGSTVTAVYIDPRDPADTSQDTAAITLNPSGSVTTFTDSLGNIRTQFPIGAQGSSNGIFITVDDANRNQNPLAVDFINATLLDSVTGDSETVQLRETGASTAKFRNQFGFASEIGLAITDGKLQTAGNSTITANYTDPQDVNDFSFALASVFVSPGTTAPTLKITDAVGTEQLTVPVTKDPLFPTLFVTLRADEENTNASTQQSVQVTVSSPRDSVTFSLQETTLSTGVFRNAAGISLLLGNGNPNNAALEAFDGDNLTVSFFSARRNQIFVTPGGRYTARITAGNSTTAFTSIDGSARTTYAIGQEVFVTVNDADQNGNPNVSETLTVTVTATVTNDTETLTLVETNCNSGVFRNSLSLCGSSLGSSQPLTSNIAVPAANNGQIETVDRSIIRVTYVDPNDVADTQQSSATMILPEVASRVDFIAGPMALGTVSSYFIGSGAGRSIFIRVTDADANSSPVSTQVVNVTVSDPNTKDVESVTLAELTSSSTVFENLVGLPTRVTTALVNDGILGTQDGSRILVTYQDSSNPVDRSTAAATVAVTQTLASDLFFSNAAGVPQTTPYIIGREGVFLTLRDQDENKLPSVSESVKVTFSDRVTSDVETLILVETRTDSGEFRNVSPGISSVVDNGRVEDGVLQTAQASTLIATYVDVDDPVDRRSTNPGATTSRPALVGFPVFTDRDDNPVSSYIIGLQPIFIRLVDADQNTNPLTRETVTGQVRLTSSLTADEESLTLTETSTNTGIFRNNLTPLPTRIGNRSDNDGTLQVGAGAIVTARYFDTKPTDVTTTTIRMDIQRTQARVTLTSVSRGTATSQFLIGQQSIFVTVEDPDQNLNPSTTETVQVTLRNNSTGDTEILNLNERTTNDRFFDSVTGVPSVIDTAINGDGTLQSSGGSTVEASYIDRVDLTDRASATTTMVVPVTAGTIQLTNATGTVVSNYRIGQDDLFVTVTDPDQNTDASSAQSVLVTLTDSIGDRVDVQLAETSFNSGVFRNLNTTSTGVPAIGRVPSAVAIAITTNTILETRDGATVTASYRDMQPTTVVVLNAASTLTLAPTTATARMTNDQGQTVSFYTVGISGIFVTVDDIDENRDPTVQERIRATILSSPVGDSESLDLFETTSSSASFRNPAPLTSVIGPRISGNNLLEVSSGGLVIGSYTDAQDATDSTSVSVPIFTDSANSRIFFTRSSPGSIVATEPGYAVASNQALSEEIFVEVRDTDENSDGSSPQSLVVTLQVILPGGAIGDQESLTLQELNNNSDTFRNGTGMPSLIAPATSNDRVIQTTDGASLLATYIDKDFSFDRSQNQVRTRIRQTAAILEAVDADGVAQSRFLLSVENLFAQVTDPDENRNPSVRESVIVTLSAVTGDLESLVALETAPDTGIFRSQSGIRTAISTVSSQGNGVLELLGNGAQETVSYRYRDRDDGSDAPSLTVQVVFQEVSAVTFVNASGVTVTSYIRDRDGIIVSVRDRDSNRSIGVAETVTATVEDLSTTDQEVVTLVETGLNTGIFRNTGNPLSSALVFPANPNMGDNLLQAGAVSHQIRAVYRDVNDPADTSSATVDLNPADPLDSDADGIPDSFENGNGLNAADPRDASLDNDGDGRSNLQEFLDGTDPNNPNDNRPISRPGTPRSEPPGKIRLDGGSSSSPGGLPLTYRWRQVSGPVVTLSGSATVTPDFTALAAGVYEFELTVNNGRTDSFPNRLQITILDVSPVADAGPFRTVDIGSPVTFIGDGSRDPNGGTLTYSWIPVSGTLPAPANATTSRPVFTPVQARFYPIQLTVTDSGGNTGTARTGLIVNGGANDRLPTANAGQNRTARTGTVVTLDGRVSSDADGNTLNYRWTFISGPQTVTLNSIPKRPDSTVFSKDEQVTFTPLQEGVYTFQLVVNDSPTGDPARDSAPSEVCITVNGTNTVPTAQPGANQTVTVGATVTLDGRASSDANRDPLTYRWTQIKGSSVVLSSVTSAAPIFTPALTGVHAFQLVVNDGRVDSKAGKVTVTVDDGSNRVPVANAGTDLIGNVGTPVNLNGSASFDADGAPLLYGWAQTGGPNVTLGNQTGPTPVFTPNAAGLYQFSLVVSDGVNESTADPVQVAVNSSTSQIPVANAGQDQTAFLGTSSLTVQLNGNQSFDPKNKTPLSYTWTQTDGTNVSLLPDARSSSPTFTAPITGNYRFGLTVQNTDGLPSPTDEMVVTVVDGTTSPPLARINGGSPGGNEVVRAALDTIVILDAGTSQSLNGSGLTFLWTQTAGTPVVLSSRTASQATFIPRVAGTYSFTVTVTDAQSNSSTASVSVFAGGTAPTTGGNGVTLGSVPQAGSGASACALPRDGKTGHNGTVPVDLLILMLPLLAIGVRRGVGRRVSGNG